MEDKRISSELIYRSTDNLTILLILSLGVFYTKFYSLNSYIIAGLSAVILFGLIGRFTEIYASWSGRPLKEEAIRIIITWTLTFLALIFIAFASKTSENFSRIVLVSWAIATPLVLILSRYSLRKIFAHLRKIGINNRTVAIVGITENGLRFAQDLENHPEYGYHIAGFYDERQGKSRSTNLESEPY